MLSTFFSLAKYTDKKLANGVHDNGTPAQFHDTRRSGRTVGLNAHVGDTDSKYSALLVSIEHQRGKTCMGPPKSE